jgi:hypothetical protein
METISTTLRHKNTYNIILLIHPSITFHYPPPKMSAEEVAKAFVQHFYQTFDTNVDGLAGLYVSQ